MLPLQSLSAATVTGPGGELDVQTVASDFTMWFDIDGTSGSATVRLEGSPDGAIWVPLASDFTGTGVSTISAGFRLTGSAGSWRLCRYVRANVVSISGDRAVTAWLAADVSEEA